MRKTIHYPKAKIQVLDAIKDFNSVSAERNALGKPFTKMTSHIENVGYADLMTLYNRMGDVNKMLFMPWELDSDRAVIIFIPAPGFVIHIESEPANRMVADINKFSNQ